MYVFPTHYYIGCPLISLIKHTFVNPNNEQTLFRSNQIKKGSNYTQYNTVQLQPQTDNYHSQDRLCNESETSAKK